MTSSLSIITPMHNESEVISTFFETLIPILDKTKLIWEIILIDDGSTDDTYQQLCSWKNKVPNITLIKFSRNFGKEAALTAGLDHCHSDAAIILDADLQDPPELIPEMVSKWNEGFDVVLASRNQREDETAAKRATASLFYWLINRISTSPVPKNTGDFRLITQKAISAIRSLPERVRFMKGILSWPGFNTYTIYYNRPGRTLGKTSWNLAKLTRLALDGIFSFSDVPLKLVTFLGIITALSSFIYAIFIIVDTLITGIDVPGHASLMTVILFLGGVQLIGTGIVGEYIGRIYLETKQRPIYIVDQLISSELNDDA